MIDIDTIDQIVADATAAVAVRGTEVPGPRTQADIDRLSADHIYSYSNQRLGQAVGSNSYAPRPRGFWERVKGRWQR